MMKGRDITMTAYPLDALKGLVRPDRVHRDIYQDPAIFELEMAQRAFDGTYEYRLIRNGAGFKIASKKATVINCDATLFPLALPF